MELNQFTKPLIEIDKLVRQFFDSVPQLGWTAYPDGVIDFYNRRFHEYTGLTAEELHGRGWNKIVHVDDYSRVCEQWNNSLETLANFEMKFQLRRHDGAYRLFLAQATPVLNDDGCCIRWIGVNTDIQDEIDRANELAQSERRLNEQLQALAQDRGQRLAHVEALNESVIESISDAIVVADPQSRLTYLNEAARRMLGNQPQPMSLKDAAENKRNYDQTGERLLPAEELPLSRALAGELVNDCEMVLRSNDGKRKIVSVSARPIIDRNGDFKGAVAVVRDINARKTAEEALQKALIDAVEANRLKSQFVANISHEIRTPMSGILGLSELLVEETEGTAKELANHIFSSAECLMHLVNDLLDISKAEAGKLIISEELFSIGSLLESVCATFRGSALRKKLELVFEVSHELSEEVHGDSRLVRQVLQNLVQNAVKFTDSGRILVKAELQSRTADTLHVRFSVKDTGAGISLENQSKLFQLFVQVDGSTTRRHGGTGLGLAISKRIVELMNGEIGVESAEGQGATFFFTLPFDCKV